MEKLEINLYEFGELQPEAQKRALEILRERHEVFLEFFDDSAQEQIGAAGFRERSGDGKPALRYSLGYSQGDGLSFTIKSLDLFAFCKAHRIRARFRRILRAYENYDASGSIEGSGHYCHEKSVRLSIEYRKPELEKEAGELEEIIDRARLELCKKLAAQGYEEIEGQLSDESLKEDAEANEWQFLHDGRKQLNV